MRVAQGARVLAGGRRHALGGTFYEPTLLADVSLHAKLAQEEIFGPVAPLFRFETEDEALRLANDTEFGLAAYFYSRDLARVWRVARRLEYGMVGINSGIISTAVAPFGGVKQIGLRARGLAPRHRRVRAAEVPLHGGRLMCRFTRAGRGQPRSAA